jgi:hypothetical protein
MDLRHHVTRAVDYSIRVTLISLIAVPLWVGAWFGACGLVETPDPASTAGHVCRDVAIPGLVFLSPGYGALLFLRLIHIPPLLFGMLDFLVAFLAVPTFWGTVAYAAIQLFRHVLMSRHRLTRR